ncbi:hypothetical protein BT69DRAFT_1350207 [Atractiella rhizophila]|nr:hypothetical protein BT69DRAFT_1350207 [Atractiella rhizophila]
MAETWSLACDRQFDMICELLVIVLDRDEKLPRSLLREGFCGKVEVLMRSILNFCAFAQWSNRFPHRKPLIERWIKILKHISYLKKSLADQVTDLEAEMEQADASYSPPKALSSPHSSFLGALRSPSPSLSDFSTTLGAVLAM